MRLDLTLAQVGLEFISSRDPPASAAHVQRLYVLYAEFSFIFDKLFFHIEFLINNLFFKSL